MIDVDTPKSNYANLLQMLKDYKWRKNTSRTKLGGYRGSNMRQAQYSTNVGYIKRMYVKGRPIEKGVYMKNNNDEIYNECKRLFPDFDFNGVMINKNFKCPPHKDNNNKGLSLCMGLGDYELGQLVVEGEAIDIKYKPHIFHGGLQEHYVNEWTGGDRYSIVLFTVQ
jgi:hypothetical protein